MLGYILYNYLLFNSAIIQISQDIRTETDPQSKCKNYPDELYENYKACDKKFVYDKLIDTENIVPFWTAYNLEEVAKILTKPLKTDLYDYYDGTIASPCLTPCYSTKASILCMSHCRVSGGDISAAPCCTEAYLAKQI